MLFHLASFYIASKFRYDDIRIHALAIKENFTGIY